MTEPLLAAATLALHHATGSGTWGPDASWTAPGELAEPAAAGPAGLTVGEGQRLAGLITRARSTATTRAYTSDVARWTAWRVRRGTDPERLESALVALHLEEAASAVGPDGAPAYAPATLARWVSSLNHHARATGQPPPGEHALVRAVLAAVRRTGTRSPRRRDPLLPEDLQRLLAHLRSTVSTRAERIAATRDSALLLVGFYGAFRRAELASLQLRDVVVHPAEGLRIHLRRSKTDQEATGVVKPLPPHADPALCPVCAVLAWTPLVQGWDSAGRPGLIRAVHLATTPLPGTGTQAGHGAGCPHHGDTDLGSGRSSAPPVLDDEQRIPNPSTVSARPVSASTRPLFRSLHPAGLLRGPLSGHAVNDMIRRRAAAAGLDPDRLPALGGHSLRAGFVTAAYRAGATAEQIARQTGHTSLTVLATYQRERDPLRGNAVTHLSERADSAQDKGKSAPGGQILRPSRKWTGLRRSMARRRPHEPTVPTRPDRSPRRRNSRPIGSGTDDRLPR